MAGNQPSHHGGLLSAIFYAINGQVDNITTQHSLARNPAGLTSDPTEFTQVNDDVMLTSQPDMRHTTHPSLAVLSNISRALATARPKEDRQNTLAISRFDNVTINDATDVISLVDEASGGKIQELLPGNATIEQLANGIKLLRQVLVGETNLSVLYNPPAPPSEPMYTHRLPWNTFCIVMSFISFFIVLLLSFTVTRKHLWPKICLRRPGLLIPLNMLEDRRDRIAFIAAYGVMANAMVGLLFSPPPINIGTSPYMIAINMIGSLLVYCLAYYPIFACLSMKSVLGYLTGCVYVWTFLGAELVWIFWPYKELHRYNLYATRYALLQLLPSLLFLILLSLMMPVKAWKMWHERKRSKDQVVLQEFYQAEHVRRLLQKPEPYARCKRVTADSLGEKLRDLLTSVIYSKVPGFRYSPRILASVVVWAQFIYIITFGHMLLIVDSYHYIRVQLHWLHSAVDMLFTTDLTTLMSAFGVPYISNINPSLHTAIDSLQHHVYILGVCLMVGNSIAICITFLMMLHFLASYRNDLLQLYRGRYNHLAKLNNVSFMAASLRVNGYQVAYGTWGFAIQSFLIGVTLFLLCEIVIFVKNYGTGLFLMKAMGNVGIPAAVALGLVVMQLLLARYAFLQEDGETLSLDNRRLYFIMAHVLFLYNMVIGLLSCVLRVCSGALVGIWFVTRLDRSLLPRLYERFDPGYTAYVGYLRVENAHMHPVMATFNYLLVSQLRSGHSTNPDVSLSRPALNNGETEMQVFSPATDRQKRGKRARIRWFLALTLHRNPNLVALRKRHLGELRYRCAMEEAMNSVLGFPASPATIAMTPV